LSKVRGYGVIKRLAKHRDGLALVLDEPLLKRLGIDADTPLEVATDGRVLIVSPVRGRVEKALAAVNRRYARALRRLAE